VAVVTQTTPGSARLHFVVTDADTAIALGSGDLPVLATPRLIAWCEAACVACLDLVGDQTSVGTRVEVEHVGAVVVGAPVEVSATIAYEDGRLTRFDVMAETAADVDVAPVRLMHGSMTRVAVDRQRFMARLM